MSTQIDKSSLAPDAELIVEFVNTRDVEEGTDAIAEPAALETWIAARTEEYPGDLDPDDVARVQSLRESLRLLLRRNNGGEAAAAELTPLREAAERTRIRTAFSDDGELELVPARSGLSGFEARLLMAVEHLQCHGAWPRLKACTDEGCQWAFFDATRNHSRTWCSMDVCGNREKTRRYRERRMANPKRT
ncbi:MAG TPA: CGNR zinc finger domain-containing protein [Solirubrobacterales bacterium]|nr:CGNR zinc finger domain-containing protein [Solirubrobacterales bacterium]